MAAPKSWEQYKEECIPVADSKQIQVLGWTGEWKGVNTKLDLLCHCGYKWDTTSINSFKRGSGCPMCVGQIKDLKTYLTECKPIAEAKGITIIGIVEPFKGTYTKMMLRCKYGHEWNTCSFGKFKHGNDCPVCRSRELQTTADDQHIADFFSTGVFPEGTIFTNTGRSDKFGKSIWMIECPVCSHDEYVKAGVCNGKFYSRGCQLKQGSISCRCATNYHYTEDQITYRVKKEVEREGYVWVDWITKPSSIGKFKYLCLVHGEQIGSARNLLSLGQGCPQCAGHSQQQLYVNVVKDNGIIVALKFGISKDSDRRLNGQNSRNLFFMERICLYDFSTVKQCRAAERAIKKKLKTGILTARELKDGYTETVSVSDLENLQKIITQYGGKLVYSKEM